jgi:hypothetical protein
MMPRVEPAVIGMAEAGERTFLDHCTVSRRDCLPAKIGGAIVA